MPAEELKLSPVDQVFVRMGARDNIMAGQSTFLVELQETAIMLVSANYIKLHRISESFALFQFVNVYGSSR